ncbi:MAG TPA: HD domain-containing phosphohydrolase, partial [Chloroflexota bacterium]
MTPARLWGKHDVFNHRAREAVVADAQASDLRLAELIAALSLATDLGMGQPPEFALRSCVLAIRLGDALHLGTPDLHDVYYQALLRYIGCNAETFSLAALFGDELALRTEFVTIDQGRSSEVIGFALRRLRRANAGAPLLRLVRNVARGLVMAPGVVQEGYAGHCEVAQRLAARLHFGDTIIRALGQLYERWDGRGAPNGLKGENVALAVRVVALAQDAIVFQRIGGVEAAVAVARARKGTAYDPRIATCFCEQAPRLLAGLEDEPSWEAVLAMEPGPRTYLPAARFDTACQAIADFADLKSPYTLGH